MSNCTYCGVQWGETRDHVTPVSFTHFSRTFDGTKTVPCCKECNALLGNRMFVSVPTRAAYLAGRLKEKNKKLLRIPDWSEEDLEEMSPRMAKSIKATIDERDMMKQRIEHCEAVAMNIVEECFG